MIQVVNEMVGKWEGMGKRVVKWQVVEGMGRRNIRMFLNKQKKEGEKWEWFQIWYRVGGWRIGGKMWECKVYVEIVLNGKYGL